MTSLSRRRNNYLRNVFWYEKRRIILREKLTGSKKRPRRPSAIYLKRVKVCNDKLRHWRRMIVTLDKKRKQIVLLEKSVRHFSRISLRKEFKGVSIPHCIYFKFGLENGINGKHLSEYIGYKKVWNVSRFRKKFTSSFQTNPENKEVWMRFKQFHERKIA